MSAATHAAPSGDCVMCCEDFDENSYVEYQAQEGGEWYPAPYCESCICHYFINGQWQTYLDNINKAAADCAAALRRLLTQPPPLYVKDAGFAKCKKGDVLGDVHQFWFNSSNSEVSAKLKNAPEGAERDAFYAEKKACLAALEVAEAIAKTEEAASQPQ